MSCPIPECDRVFCTERCSASCLVQCADPLCLLPNRCRPCASGKTLELLLRRNIVVQHGLLPAALQTPIAGMHRGFATCDVCLNKVCSECSYLNACSKCHKQACLECIDSDRFILNSCGGDCNAVYCDQCEKDLMSWPRNARVALWKPNFLPRKASGRMMTRTKQKCGRMKVRL